MRGVVSLAVVLIVIAVLMFAAGVFVEGASILFWLGIIIAVGALVLYVLGGRRNGPPL